MTKRIQLVLLASQFLMLLAVEMANPFLPLLIAKVTTARLNTAVFYTTLALALPMLATIIMSPLWGFLADRWGYKKMLLRASWALVISQGLMIFADSLTWILTVRTLQGAFAGFIAAMQMYALSACEWQRKGRQMARLQAAKALATALAGVVGGVLLTFCHYEGLYFLATLLCLITTLMMQRLLPEVATAKIETPAIKPQRLGSSWGLFTTLGVLICLTQTARFFTDPVFSLSFSHLLHASPLMVGVLYSLPAAGILLSTDWIGRLFDTCRTNPAAIRNYLLYFSCLGVVLMAAHAYATQVLVLIPIRLLWGLVLTALLPALCTLLHDYHRQQGYALGMANAFAKMGNLIGIFLGGYLAAFLSLTQLFLLVAALYGLLAVCSYSYYFFFTTPLYIRDGLRHE